MGLLDDKTALVTGGSIGIGLASAVRLAAEGAHVIVTGRREQELTSAVTTIGDATGVVGDVSVAADLDRLYERVRELGRGLDVVFANAAVQQLGTLEELTEDAHDRVFDINVKGVFLTVQKALPLLNDGASIVLTSSTAAPQGQVGMGAYAASKAAVRSYARTWTNELAARGIRVNAISPGPTDTPLFDVLGDSADAAKAAIGASLPAKRMGTPEEIAAAVVFLASSQSSFVRGADLVVDGGELVADGSGSS